MQLWICFVLDAESDDSYSDLVPDEEQEKEDDEKDNDKQDFASEKEEDETVKKEKKVHVTVQSHTVYKIGIILPYCMLVHTGKYRKGCYLVL